jgi:uncharacterized integral membrane protein (TIGR00698 family)
MATLNALRPPALAGIGPGLLASLVAAAAAAFLSDHYGGPVMLFALLLGMAMNFLGEVERCRAGISFASRTLLRIGVAMLGFRITLWQIAELGWQPVVLVVSVVTLTILASIWIAKRMGFDPLFGLLTGGATAICGASAALALSAAIPEGKLKQRDTAFTIMGVSILSTVAMILYPAAASLLGLDDRLAGIFIGASIHDVAQVVGAGFAISPEAGDTATVIKLMRVAMLAPVIVAVGLLAHRNRSDQDARPPLLPLFVVAFLVLVVMNSLLPIPTAVQDVGSSISRWCLVAAIAALGMKTRLGEIAEIGWKPVLLMVAETLFIAALALAAIAAGWV